MTTGLFAPDERCDGCGESWCFKHDDHYADCACIGWGEREPDDLTDGGTRVNEYADTTAFLTGFFGGVLITLLGFLTGVLAVS